MLLAAEVPENVYRGELIQYPGQWGFQMRRPGIILVTDQELEALASDPDKVLNLTTGRSPRNDSLRGLCERAKAQGHRTLMIAFDHFFAQYRPGQNAPRQLMPDMDEYIQRMAKIGKFAEGYGLRLELSLLSPLELGKAYARTTGESGIWMHYREGMRDPKTGVFSVELWQHRNWANNKGVIDVEDAGVRVFAFRETPMPDAASRIVDPAARTPYHVVDPNTIVEVKDGIRVERMDNVVARSGDFRARRIRVYGTSPLAQEGLDRVLVEQL